MCNTRYLSSPTLLKSSFRYGIIHKCNNLLFKVCMIHMSFHIRLIRNNINMINANRAFGGCERKRCAIMQLDQMFLYGGTLLPLSVIYVSSAGHMYNVRIIIIVSFGSKDLSLSPSQMKNIHFKLYTRKRINISIFHRI